MAISFNTDDKLTIYRTQGGERQELITIAELNTLLSAEEQAELTDLQAQVGSLETDYWGIEPAATHDTCESTSIGSGIIQVQALTAGKWLTI